MAIINRTLKLAWLAACLAALLHFYIAARGETDSFVVGELREEFVIIMYPLTFPVGILSSILIDLVMRDDLYNGSLPLYINWIALVLSGYVQWFIIVPSIIKWLRTR